MGATKALMAEQETNSQWAQALLKQTGAVDECEIHEYLSDNYDPDALEEACKLAEKEPPAGMLPAKARQLVIETLGEIGDDCPGCEKNRAE